MYAKKMSQAIRGADRWRERTKQTTAFPNWGGGAVEEALCETGSPKSARTAQRLGLEKSKEHSMFRSETSDLWAYS